MNINLNWGSVKGFVREVASVVGIVISLGNFAHLSPNLNTALLAVSGWLQVVQHKLDTAPASSTASSTTNPTTPGV